MYKLHIWKSAIEDGFPKRDEETYEFTKKPTFSDMYPLLDCDMIEILHGYDTVSYTHLTLPTKRIV